MKPLLFVLLAASLAANVVLALRTKSPVAASPASTTSPAIRASSPPAVADAARPAGTTDVKAAPVASATPVWKPVANDADLHRLVTDLRGAGFPPAVIRAVVGQLLNDRFASRQPGAGQPFWKQGVPTPETIAAQNALQKERQALFESLLGADARPSATMDMTSRQRRYGHLSDEKLDAVARIERDYGEMNAELWARRRGNASGDGLSVRQGQQMMEEEKLADLATVLTPDELAQYEMRNSATARTVMNNLHKVEISEREYAQIYAAQKDLDAAYSTSAGAVNFAQRQADQLVVHEKARAVLGEERFYSYLEGADMNYAQAAKTFSAFPAVTPEKTYAVYQLQIELQGIVGQLTRDGPLSPEKIAEVRKTSDAYNAQLEQIVGPDAAEAYRKLTMGRMFRPGGNAPGRVVPSFGR